jgi:signal transduction histidine kinase
MKIIDNRRIFIKIVALLITVSVLPLSALAFFLSRTSKSYIRETVFSEFQNISNRAAKEIFVFVSGRENIINFTSEVIASTYQNEWESKLILRNLVQNLDGFESIDFRDKHGKTILGSDIEEDNTDYLKSSFFKKALRGSVSYSKIYISNALMPTMKICIPVRKLNKIIGVLIAKITVRYLWELADSIVVGKSGHAYIVNKGGIVIAHPQKDRVIKCENFQNIPIVKKLSKGINSSGEYINENGINVLGAGTIVEDLDWGVVVEQSAEEAFSLVNKIHYLTITLVVIAILSAITIGFFRASQIVAPIKKLTEGARNVAQGDLYYKIDVKSNDEIGELADNFNKMTSSLKDAQEKLVENERLAMLGRVASIIAHEVRNPLEAIKGASEHLKEEFTKDEEIQKFTGIIVQEADKLNGFVNDVLNSSRKIELETMPTDINEILEKTCQLILKDSRFKKINIIKSFDYDISSCFLDPEKLEMSFLNIFVNAMEAMPDGGEIKIKTKYNTCAEIEVSDESSKEQKKEHIEITVQDNGIGIPCEIKDEIFKPFFTSRKSGTGLGLAFFSEVIRQHQGYINLASEQNKGTILTIYLPIIQPKS